MPEQLKNIDVVNYIAQKFSDKVQIENLFWIALSHESERFIEFFDDHCDIICREAFPELKINTEDITTASVIDILMNNHNRNGLLAQVYFADEECGCYLFYMYGETREELYEKIVQKAKEIYGDGE